MLFPAKAHRGEAKVFVWDYETIAVCREKGVSLL